MPEPVGESDGAAAPAGGENVEDPRQQAEIEQLKKSDRTVRAHEMAHVAAGGQYVTHAATYSYRRGPDGQLYAVAGEVGIDTSEVTGDPQATLRKAMTVQGAALAPADPSPQDRAVAARAAQMAAKASAQLAAGQNGMKGARAIDAYARGGIPDREGFRAYA